jgi:hypothetical protein
MKQKREGEQQPLGEDISLIDDNIRNLEEKEDQLKSAIKYGFSNLLNLQDELGTYEMKMN